MAETFNPYRTWLDLDLAGPPESDYELFRLRDFENDQASIVAAADRAIAKVRSFRPGDQAAAWSRLLDELNGAKRRLSNAETKSQYDAELKARRAGEGSSAPAPVAAAPRVNPAPTVADDPRYPPGMAPRGAAASPSPAPQPVPATSPASNPGPSFPPSSSYPPNPSYPPDYNAAPQQPVVPQQPVAPQPAPYAMPMAAPYQQPAMPAYGMPQQPMYGAPQAMPLQPQQGTGYGMPMPGYAPSAMPMAQPGAWPAGMTANYYAAPPSPPPPAPPVSPYAEAHYSEPAAAIDPMAPVDFTGDGATATALPMGSAYVPNAYDPGAYQPAGFATESLPVGMAVAAPLTESAGEQPLELGPKLSASSAAKVAIARSRSSALMPVILAVGAALGILAVIVVWGALNEDEIADEQAIATNPAPVNPTPVKPKPEPVKPAPVKPMPAPMPVTPEPVTPGPMPMPEMVDTMKPPLPKPAEEMPEPKPEPKPEPMPDPLPKPPEPPVPPKPAPPALPTREQVAELSKALGTARIALTEGNLEEAKTQLGIAEALPLLPEHKPLVERLKMLTDYNGQFWNAVAEAMKTFKSGTEIMVGSQVLVVVEATPTHLILRVAGKNKSYPVRELPAGIAVAVADMWFEPSDPAARVMKGAYAAVNRAGNTDKAREWWEQATLSGVDVKSIMPVLEDKYDGLEKDLERAQQARMEEKQGT